MHLEPALPRYQFAHTPSGIRVTVPARRHWLAIIFICLWLIAWAFAEIQVISKLSQQEMASQHAFLYVWLTGWTLGGGWALLTLLWQLSGKESISVEHGAMIHRVEVLGVGRSRSFAAHEIRHLRAVDYASNMFSNQAAWKPPFFGVTTGPLAFDYGAKAIRIAPSLDEAEARLLLPKLMERLPASASEDRASLYNIRE